MQLMPGGGGVLLLIMLWFLLGLQLQLLLLHLLQLHPLLRPQVLQHLLQQLRPGLRLRQPLVQRCRGRWAEEGGVAEGDAAQDVLCRRLIWEAGGHLLMMGAGKALVLLAGLLLLQLGLGLQ